MLNVFYRRLSAWHNCSKTNEMKSRQRKSFTFRLHAAPFYVTNDSMYQTMAVPSSLHFSFITLRWQNSFLCSFNAAMKMQLTHTHSREVLSSLHKLCCTLSFHSIIQFPVMRSLMSLHLLFFIISLFGGSWRVRKGRHYSSTEKTNCKLQTCVFNFLSQFKSSENSHFAIQ